MPLDILPDDTQQAIVDAAAALLDTSVSTARLRAQAPGPVRSESLWAKATEQGWFGLAVPEAQGGLGLGLVEQHLITRVLGQTLTPGPYLGTMLAADVAAAAGAGELDEIVAGAPVGLLVDDQPAESELAGSFYTDDADDATRWLALTPSGAVLIDDIVITRLPASSDFGARRGTAQLERPAGPAVTGGAWWVRATVLVASELAGLADAAVQASVLHTRTREQFGRPIGSFQMVQQRVADMATRADAATQLTALAALAVQAGQDGAAQLAASALLIAGDAGVQNARDDIQNHGGLGYTWEIDSHLRLRRAHGLRMLLGDPSMTRAAVLDGDSPRAW
jgi:alkylation response protein AidB-like acyl-CoA dehydrogenase